ncbi:MAG: hypothetical protein MUF53_02765 [Gemmatimonadaceae bacterium]|jgi:tetratricopeptide (TPR) repeat protein|nr:hypothetical protein [Gemmatimonadaceae bacterium]
MPAPGAPTRTNPDTTPAVTAVRVQGLVFVAAAAIALNALGNGFPNDDQWIVAEALDFRHPTQWGHALARPWWPYANALWRPVTTLQLAIETWLGGGRELPYHAINCLWHGLASLLVTRLALRWVPPTAALFAGLWFAWMPIHVEPIATLVGRADLGVTVFLLAAALAATREGPFDRARGWELFAWSALAMGSKESGIAAPAVIWAMARLRRGQVESLGMAAAGAAGLVPLLLGRFFVLGTFGGDDPHPTWVGMAWGPATMLALRFLAVGVSYIGWPRTPVFEHAPPQTLIDAPEPWLVATGSALVVAALVAFARQWTRATPAGAAVLWWAATILPVSNLVFRSGIVLADRTLYGPSVASALLLALLLAWADRDPSPVPRPATGGPVRRSRAARYALTGGLVLFAAAITWRDLPRWRSSQTFIEAILERAPDAWPGYLFRGMARAGSGDRAGAIADYEAGIARFGREQRLRTERAKFALQDGDTIRAVDHLERALAAHPRALRPRQVLLDVYARLGRSDRRCIILRDGARIAPDQRRWTSEWATMQAQGGCR